MASKVAASKVDVLIQCAHCEEDDRFTVCSVSYLGVDVGMALPTIRKCPNCDNEYRIHWRVGCGEDPATRIEG